MKKLFTALMALALVASSAYADEKKDTVKFSVVKEIPITSVKDQNQSGTCWCYSTLAFLEAELLRKGKGTFDLCESFVVHHTMTDRAEASVRMHGDVSFAEGGSFLRCSILHEKLRTCSAGCNACSGFFAGRQSFQLQRTYNRGGSCG